MSASILWAIAAAASLIAELLSGTFYLLVLCLAFSIGAALAALGFAPEIQIATSALTGLVGLALVRRWRAKNKNTEPALPCGPTTATIISVQAEGYRVRWRGTEWDAKGPAGLSEASVVAIVGQTGNTLHIEPR